MPLLTLLIQIIIKCFFRFISSPLATAAQCSHDVFGLSCGRAVLTACHRMWSLLTRVWWHTANVQPSNWATVYDWTKLLTAFTWQQFAAFLYLKTSNFRSQTDIFEMKPIVSSKVNKNCKVLYPNQIHRKSSSLFFVLLDRKLSNFVFGSENKQFEDVMLAKKNHWPCFK